MPGHVNSLSYKTIIKKETRHAASQRKNMIRFPLRGFPFFRAQTFAYQLLLTFFLKGDILTTQPANGDELEVVVVKVLVGGRIVVDIFHAEPMGVAREVLRGEDDADAMIVFTCCAALANRPVTDGQFQVAAVLHFLVVGHAVVIGLGVWNVADTGVGGINTVILGDAGDFAVDIVLHDASLRLIDGADTNLIRPWRYTGQTIGKVVLSSAGEQITFIFVPTVIRHIVGEFALIGVNTDVLAISIGDEEARASSRKLVTGRTVVPAEVVVGQFGNNSGPVDTDDVVEHVASHHIVIVDEQVVK